MPLESPPVPPGTPNLQTIEQLRSYRPPPGSVARMHVVGRRPDGRLESLADVASHAGMPFWDYVDYLFPGCRRKPECVNWYLWQHYKCPPTRDGKNRIFVGGEKLPLPKPGGLASGAPTLAPTRLSHATVRACIEVVKGDPVAKSRIKSFLSFLPGSAPGGVRNFMLALCDVYTGAKACDPSEPNSYANRVVCTGISEAVVDALKRGQARVPQLVEVSTRSRQSPIDHTAVEIVVQAPGHAPATYVLDWWASLEVDHPFYMTADEFDKGQRGTYFR